MKGFIRRLLEKQIVPGSLSVKLSTVAVTAASVLVVGGTANRVPGCRAGWTAGRVPGYRIRRTANGILDHRSSRRKRKWRGGAYAYIFVKGAV